MPMVKVKLACGHKVIEWYRRRCGFEQLSQAEQAEVVRIAAIEHRCAKPLVSAAPPMSLEPQKP